MAIFSGACHCGNITFGLHTEKEASAFIPRQCSCGLCRKHRAAWISDPESTAHVHYRQRDLVSTYRFGHKTADFIVCARCGVLTMAHCEVDGHVRAVLNINAMSENLFTAAPVTTRFDDEDSTARLARRALNWTGNVIFD